MNSRWTFAVIASLALHAVILVVLVGWHMSSEKTEGPNAPAMEKPPPAAASAEVAPTEMEKPEKDKQPAIAKTASEPASMLSSEDEAVEPKPVKKPEAKAPAKVATAKDPKPVKTEPAKASKPAKGHKFTTYVVKPGDSLTAIAKECGCTPAELAKLNGKSYKAFAKLWVGQKIKVKAKEDKF